MKYNKTGKSLIKKIDNRYFTFDKQSLICVDKNNKTLFKKKVTNGSILDLIIYVKKKLIIVLAWPSENTLGRECMDDSLMAYNTHGRKVWSAELPVTNDFRFYTELLVEDGKLYAFENVEYKCEMDPETGKIIRKIFTK